MRPATFVMSVLLSFAHLTSASAASPEVCDQYAKDAIAQLQEARSLGLPTPFPVWSDDYQHHYSWCLRQTDDALVQGRALRQDQIDSAAAVARQPAPTPVVIDSIQVAAPASGPQTAPATLPLPIPRPAQAGPTQGNTISQLQLATGKASRLQAATTAALVYSDRDFTYTQLPREVAAGLAVATANDDKFAPAEAPYLRFRLDRPAMVYVAYDQRYRQRPAWLKGFQPTNATVSYRAGAAELRLQLFSRAFPAGEVVLGGNLASGEQGNFGMYTVFVVPSAPPADVQVAGASPSGAGVATRPSAPEVAAAVQQQEFELRPPGTNAGQVSTPLLMYYVERRVVGIPQETEADAFVAQRFQSSPETRKFYLQLLEKYKALPAHNRQLMFDPEVLQLTSSPYNTVTASDVARISTQRAMSPSLSGIQALENPDPPEPPSRLVSVNSSGSSMEQQGSGNVTSLGIFLQWRWDRPDRPEGFAIYRRLPSQTEFQLLTEVPASTVEYRDSPLPQPSTGQDAYCYEVRAFVRPLMTVAWQSNRIESRPSNTSCTTYGPYAQPLADTDSDGMADPFDWCPNDGEPPTMPRVQGCPDGDVDGLIDSAPGGSVPASMIDHCPPGAPGLDGYGPGRHGSQWDHLRSIDPLPGCPVRYQLRWMGLEVLNDPVDCTDPNAPYRLGCDGEVGLGNEYGQTNEAITPGLPLPPGFEPYLVFGMLNGVSDQGMAQQWTKRWCCGEGVQVGIVAVPDFPPSTINPNGIEPDTDFRGAESYEADQTVLERGLLLFPEKFDVLYSSIDEQFGLILTTTLFERDFDMQYTPDKNETDINAFLEKGVGFMSNIVSCASTGGLGCAKALGEKIASLLTLGLTSNQPADPVTVRDRDDVFGVASTSFTSREAADATSATGAYPFSQLIPGDGSYYVSFSKSIVPPPPLDSRARSVATMHGRSRFCLVRQGLGEAEILQLCRQ